MARDLDTIVELQRALTELQSVKGLFAQGPAELQELATEHGAHNEAIAGLEQKREAADQERRSAETEVQDAQVKLERYQQQINKVTTQREYGALLSEIDTVKATIQEQEDVALAALEVIEEAEQQLETLRQEFSSIEASYRTCLDKWEARKPEVGEQIASLEGRIEVYRERLPKPVLSQYERLFERHGGEALAPISQIETDSGPQIRHCSHCNYRIRPQVVVEIQNEGTLIPCDSCQRILFLEN